MIEIPSKVEGVNYTMNKLEERLEPIGFTIGGNWDYDHGYFDYKIDDGTGDQYLRLPFQAVTGEVDQETAKVELGRPFILSHIQEQGVDEEGNVGALTGSFNQFKEPADKNAPTPDKFVDIGKTMVIKLEEVLL
ncbi:YugN-like family protein [Mesobacillus harenae]|uniref:YugN-like family protein n=1 Tax=Mesobacillus harenae TaxID=2213203 RepID=UPI001580E963|nr:YugN-like family protein [Mesobacillus harenae]